MYIYEVAHTYTHMNAHICTHTHEQAHAHTQTHTHKCAHTHKRTHRHTYTHVHILHMLLQLYKLGKFCQLLPTDDVPDDHLISRITSGVTQHSSSGTYVYVCVKCVT